MRSGTTRNTTRGYDWGYPLVAPSVGSMAATTPSSHLMHDELGTTDEMLSDCRAVGRNLRLERAASAAVETPPSIHFEDFPREIVKREIAVSDAAIRLANALQLHLD